VSTMIGGDGLARRAKATLQAQLPGALAALNAEAGAPVQLGNPGSYYLYGDPSGKLPDLAVHGVTVEVSSPDQEYESFDMAFLQADATGLVQVTVWAQTTPTGDRDSDWSNLIDTLHRYAKAVVSVLAHEAAVAPDSKPQRAAVRVRAADVSPDTPPSQPIVAGAAILVNVDYTEPLDLG
jgi:hypothetical protein